MNPTNFTTRRQPRGSTPPIIGELEAIFETLPDQELLAELKGPKRRGRPGYAPKILWRCYVAYYCLGLESVSDLIRLLYDNPYIAAACGINSPAEMPSQPTFSRFGAKLAKPAFTLLVKNVTRALTRTMFERLPRFGKSVAIDSTPLKAWSNGGKRGKNHKVSDTDAGWIVKTNTQGKNQYTFGYKAHILADCEYELPLAVDISAGNVHDIKKATPLLQQARYIFSKFNPDYVIADAAYSSNHLRQVIREQYWAKPVIDPHPRHKGARIGLIDNWKAIYGRRTAIERLNGRLKDFRKLNHIRVRGRFKVRVHVMLSVIALQARALAFPLRPRECVRAVA